MAKRARAEPPIASRERLTPAQLRIIDAAVDLFAEHGVGGTSLQMIADAVGVTKAAVYHQYPTKDAIVLAAAERELERLDAAIAIAEAEPTSSRARRVLVAHIVDLAVERRRMESTLLGDPAIVPFFTNHERLRAVMDRLSSLLFGDATDPDARVSTAMFSAAIGGAVMHPLVADLDDDVLRRQLLRLATRFLDIPEA